MTLSQREVWTRLQKDAMKRRIKYDCLTKKARDDLKAVNNELAKLGARGLEAKAKSMVTSPLIAPN